MNINGYCPIVKCICGREHRFDENTDLIRCDCGMSLTVQPHREMVRPWATMPDGYDLAGRELNKPEITGWIDADNGDKLDARGRKRGGRR